MRDFLRADHGVEGLKTGAAADVCGIHSPSAAGDRTSSWKPFSPTKRAAATSDADHSCLPSLFAGEAQRTEEQFTGNEVGLSADAILECVFRNLVTAQSKRAVEVLECNSVGFPDHFANPRVVGLCWDLTAYRNVSAALRKIRVQAEIEGDLAKPAPASLIGVFAKPAYVTAVATLNVLGVSHRCRATQPPFVRSTGMRSEWETIVKTAPR